MSVQKQEKNRLFIHWIFIECSLILFLNREVLNPFTSVAALALEQGMKTTNRLMEQRHRQSLNLSMRSKQNNEPL